MSDADTPENKPPQRAEPADDVESAEPELTLFQRMRAAPVTFAIVAINAAIFGWVETHGGTTNEATSIRYGAIEPVLFWAGEYWRVFSYMFMHSGWLHILMNMYVLIGWGTALERGLGKRRFLLLYLLAGLGGGCASIASGLFFAPHRSVGASGALFGVIGAVLALRRRQLPSSEAFFADRVVRSTLMQIGLWTVIGSFALKLDNACHFGGFVVGFAVFWLFTSAAPRNGWLAFGAAFGLLFILAARPWWSPTGKEGMRVGLYAQSFLTGASPYSDMQPWPIDIARGTRLADKGCTHGVAFACRVLADYIDSTGAPDARAKSDVLRARTCELDPAFCRQVQ